MSIDTPMKDKPYVVIGNNKFRIVHVPNSDHKKDTNGLRIYPGFLIAEELLTNNMGESCWITSKLEAVGLLTRLLAEQREAFERCLVEIQLKIESGLDTLTPQEMQTLQDAKIQVLADLKSHINEQEYEGVKRAKESLKKQAIPDAMTLAYYEDSPLARINPDCLARCQHTQGLRRCDRDKDHPGSCVYNPNTIDKRTESYKDALNQEIMNGITENFIQDKSNLKVYETLGDSTARSVADILNAEQKKWPVKNLSAEPYQVFMPVVTEDLALLEKENQTIETAKRQDKEMQPGEPVEDAGPAALDMVLKSELPTYVKVNLEEVYPKAVVPKGLDPYAWLEQKENEATVLSVKGVPLVTLLPGQHVIFERYTGGLKMDVRNSHEVESSNFLKSITVQDAANIRGNVTLGKKLPEYDENLPQAYPVTY